MYFRAFNLGGPSLVIDGQTWLGTGSPQLRTTGRSFENQAVPLHPATDAERTKMIRSSVWGDPVEVVLSDIPTGTYSVFLYVWEDNDATQFRVAVNGRDVQSRYDSRGTGIWERLGPWTLDVTGGEIRVSAHGGHANLSGIELWSGRVPKPPPPPVEPIKPKFDVDKAREFWSLRPLADVAPPSVTDSTWPASNIDRFILAQLEARGLVPVEPADKRALIRRATYDLIGLPPLPEEVDAFLADDSPEAFARVVDRLLVSPHYGERWGRHWLDVVRYADTAGDNSDYPVPQLYKYRDWVIRAFNADKPYDQFVREQLAGDLLPSTTDQEKQERIIATGYLANTRRFGSYEMKRYQWWLTYEDTIDNLGRAFLGLTINCARCHDHKFDPISTEDYYGLYGIFASTRYPWPGIELDKVPKDLVALVPESEVAARTKEQGEQRAKLDAEIKRIEKEKADADKAAKQSQESQEGESADETKRRVDEAKKLADELAKALQKVKQERGRLDKLRVPYDAAYAVAEKPDPANARVQIKGEPENLGREVPRKFPDVLGGQMVPADVIGSGRLQLAEWIADPQNPLTARVMVNRVWLYHFGKGIVQTPSDFGKQGQPPTHPELLDYLARSFIDSGWSIKALHRSIMLSRTYQLSSREDARNMASDPGSNLLWRYPRRRLDAESIRDSMLAISSKLDRSSSGEHPFPDQTTWDFTQHKPFKAVYETDRRSVYLMTQRIQRHPYLAIFDGPDTNASTARRNTSTTPLQALVLMNDPFVHEQAARFAERLLAERTTDRERIERAYLLAFSRPPNDEEQAMSEQFLVATRSQLAQSEIATEKHNAMAWESLARVMFGTNEFVYIP